MYVYIYIYRYLLWLFGLYSGHGLSYLGVSKQYRIYEVGWSALRPTPSHPGWPMGCYFFWFLPTNLPGMQDPNSICWWITETCMPRHALVKVL